MILDRPRTLGEILAEAVVLYRRDWLTYLAVASVAIVPAELLVNGIALGQLSAEYDAGLSTGAVAVGYALSFVVTGPLVTAMTIAVIVEREADRDPTVGAAVRRGFEVFGPLLLAMILVAVSVTAGAILLILPGLFLVVRLSVTAVAVVVEDQRPDAALERSFRLTKGSFWRSAGVVVLAQVIAAGVAALIVSAPLQILAKETNDAGWSFAGTMLGYVVAAPFTALAIVLLFGDLRARHADEAVTA